MHNSIKGKSIAFTSIWLISELSNLNPGILLSLHTTPTSSVCLQSVTPQPLEEQAARVASLPVQWILSNQMGPAGSRGEKGKILSVQLQVARMLAPYMEFSPNLAVCVAINFFFLM